MLKKNKSMLLLTIFLISTLLLSACGTTQHADPPNTGSNTNTSEYKPTSPIEGDNGSNAQEEANVKEQQNLTLTFFYVDDELLTMKEKEKTITYFSEEEKWTALWKELQDAGEDGFVSLWQEVELHDMEVEENQLNINLAKPENLNFGSAAEGFAIQTLLQTVGQIEGIEAVQLLIEGEIEETLAGHVSIDQPMNVDEIIYSGQ